MAHKKGLGSTRNGRDSNSQRLGVKRFGGELVTAGPVKATIMGEGRGDKVLVFKFKRKKQYKKTIGHRQSFTEVKVGDIQV